MGVLVRLASMGSPTGVGNANRVTGTQARVVANEVDRVCLVAVTGVLGDCLESRSKKWSDSVCRSVQIIPSASHRLPLSPDLHCRILGS